MDNKVFAELMESVGEVLEHARGKRELRTTVLPDLPKPMSAPEIKKLRGKLHASQAVFAHWLNVSPKLVQAWEGKQRTPQGPALLLLRLIERDPAAVLISWYRASSTARKEPARKPKTGKQLVPAKV